MLIDIGVNLMHRSFNADREQVIEAAEAAGVSPLIVTGTGEESSREALDYAEKYAAGRSGKLYATAGVHPHNAKNCGPGTIAALRSLAGRAGPVAVG